MQKDLGPKNLREAFERVAKALGGWWISGIILIVVFAVFLKVWTNTNLVPALFLLGVLIRIPEQKYPLHAMFETITISSIIIAFKFNIAMAIVFSFSAFIISRFFGDIEDPTITLQLAATTAFVAFLTPILAPHYSFLWLVVYLNVIRVLVFTFINFLIVKSVSIFIIQTFWALIVGVGLNYAIALYLINQGFAQKLLLIS